MEVKSEKIKQYEGIKFFQREYGNHNRIAGAGNIPYGISCNKQLIPYNKECF